MPTYDLYINFGYRMFPGQAEKIDCLNVKSDKPITIEVAKEVVLEHYRVNGASEFKPFTLRIIKVRSYFKVEELKEVKA